MAKVNDEYLPLSVLGSFPSDWTEATLAQVCRQVTDGTHDSPKAVSKGGFPLVTGKAIKNFKIDFSVAYNISEQDHQKVIARSKPEEDDILFANIGNSIGDVARVQTIRSFSIKNVALFKPNQEKVNPRYLEFYLRSSLVQDFIKGSTRGSAQPFIGLSSLRGFPVSLPPIGEQHAIGAFLGGLDDRIMLLGETNATLEAIAQALFKSWFVDFDPVRAKAEGRESDGLSAEVARLFPDSFEMSALGAVPKGWALVTLSEAYEINPSRKLHKGSIAPYLDMAKVRTSGHTAEEAVDREVGSGSKFINGDTLLARITPCLENGKTAFVDFLPEGHVGWGSTEFVVLRPKPPLPVYHGYLLCRHDAFREHAIQSMSGTSGRQRVQNDVLGRYPVALPTDAVCNAIDCERL